MIRVQCEQYGPLDGLAVVEGPDLRPGDGEVVIDVEAAGVNFVDALLVQGRYQVKPPLPYVPGSEVAGTVGAVGAGVTDVRVGDRVLALPSSGGYASQVVVRGRDVVAIPSGLSAGQAAGLVQSYGTMYYALTRRTTVTPGDHVVVLGAGGGIGLAAVDVATSLGARVVACASSSAKIALATSVGAVATIDYGDPTVDLKTAIREATGGGADIVCDPVGGDVAEPAMRALGWNGRYLVLGFASGTIPKFPINLVLLSSRNVIGVEWGAWVMRDRKANDEMLAELFTLVERGSLHPVEPTVRPLREAAAVLDDIQRRRVAGKVVLAP